MGNLASDTEVKAEAGHYLAHLSADWEIWGPNGGYLAAVSLRAAQAHSSLPRPATLTTHFLSIARCEPVELEVTTLRASRSAESLRVTMRQDGRSICETLVWTVRDDLPGLEHDAAEPPQLPHHSDLTSVLDLVEPGTPPPYPIWQNIEWKPLEQTGPDAPPGPPGDPHWAGWYRYFPQATFDDPFVDAARSVILLDLNPWMAAARAHPRDSGFIAPSLDLSVQFHQAAAGSDWLLLDGRSDVAAGGIVGGQARVWSSGGVLLASGTSSLLCRRTPAQRAT